MGFPYFGLASTIARLRFHFVHAKELPRITRFLDYSFCIDKLCCIKMHDDQCFIHDAPSHFRHSKSFDEGKEKIPPSGGGGVFMY